MADPIRDPLESWLRERRRDSASIVDLHRIATGNSRANWFVAMSSGDRYVARVEQGGVFGTSSAEEFTFQRAAHQLGCPAAHPRWIEPTGAVLGQRFFVMDYVDGVATGRDDRSMSPALADDFVRRLDELHRVGYSARLDSGSSTDDVTHRQIDRWADVYRQAAGARIPLLDEAAAWLHHYAAEPERIGIVHGDPGPGNFIHDGSRVIAFTDWEFAHLGDPTEDFAYLVTMRGARTMARDRWLALFERVASVTIDDTELHYWSVFNAFKGACANLTCVGAFTSTNRAPNMALIGTALHQTYIRQMAGLIETGGRR